MTTHDRTSASHIIRSAVLGILCGALIASAALWHGPLLAFATDALARSYAGVQTALVSTRVPGELADAQFLSTVGTTTTAYRATWRGFVGGPLLLPPPAAAILKYPFNAGVLLLDPAVSPDGKWVAFTQPLTTPGTPGYRVRVSIARTDAQSQHPVGDGFFPFFLDASHVGRFAPDGIVVSSVDDSSSALVLAHAFSPVTARVAAAPSGRYVAFSEGSTSIAVYAVSASSSAPAGTYQGPFTAFGLSDTALYILVTEPQGTDVEKLPFGSTAATHAASLPASLQVNGIRF